MLVKLDKSDQGDDESMSTDNTRNDKVDDEETRDTSTDDDGMLVESLHDPSDASSIPSNPELHFSRDNRQSLDNKDDEHDHTVVINGGKRESTASTRLSNPLWTTPSRSSFLKRLTSSNSSHASLHSAHSTSSTTLQHISLSHVSNGIVDIERVESPPAYTSPTFQSTMNHGSSFV